MKVKNFILRSFTVIAVVALAFPVFQADAASASLYLSPSSKSVNVGDSFSVSLYVSSDVYVNAAEATVTFSTSVLTATGVSANGVFTLCAQGPSYSNSAGHVTFTCGAPNPGYKGSAGKVITMTFKAKASGTASLKITGGQVTANDGNGTNVLHSQGSGTYTVSTPSTPPPPGPPPPPPPSGPTQPAPSVTDPVHADQGKWYNAADISVSYAGGSGVRGYSVVFDNNPTTDPGQTVTTTDSHFTRSGVPDGIAYLHVRAKYDSGWSSVTHFKFQIDTKPPEPFSITIVGDPQLNFATTDATSGVDHYEAAIDDGAFATVTSPYQTPDLTVGNHTVHVKAFDKAGNSVEASADFEVTGYAQPVIIDLSPVLHGNQPIVIHGYSNPQDSIRLTIGGDDYGPFKVSDHIDPNPPSAVPDGKVAWKLEVTPRLPNGEHEITFTAIGPDGQASPSTPPVKFKIEETAVNVFGQSLPVTLVLNLLLILAGALLLVAGFFAWKFFRLRRRFRGGPASRRNKSGPTSKFGPSNDM